MHGSCGPRRVCYWRQLGAASSERRQSMNGKAKPKRQKNAVQAVQAYPDKRGASGFRRVLASLNVCRSSRRLSGRRNLIVRPNESCAVLHDRGNISDDGQGISAIQVRPGSRRGGRCAARPSGRCSCRRRARECGRGVSSYSGDCGRLRIPPLLFHSARHLADLAWRASPMVCRFNNGPPNGNWVVAAILPFAIPGAILYASWLAAIWRGRVGRMIAVDCGAGSNELLNQTEPAWRRLRGSWSPEAAPQVGFIVRRLPCDAAGVDS
jgi:hypothetical protein